MQINRNRWVGRCERGNLELCKSNSPPPRALLLLPHDPSSRSTQGGLKLCNFITKYEGAVKEDGRGATVQDTFAHSLGKVIDGSNIDVAVYQFHRFEEDIQLMKDMGMDAYRFLIAWSRIFPRFFLGRRDPDTGMTTKTLQTA